MDELQLEVHREKWDEWEYDALHIFVNGENLIQIAKEIESAFAMQEGHPDIAGGYAPLSAKGVLPPSKHFLGSSEGSVSYGDKVALLACGGCGVVGCWPLIAKIAVQGDKVVWSDFEQPHRGPKSKSSHWRYDGMGPFVFDKKQYDRELEKACSVVNCSPEQG